MGGGGAASTHTQTAASEPREEHGFKPNERGETINTDKPVCRLCSKLVATKKGNTTYLHAHLKHNHPVEFSQLGKKAASRDAELSARQSTLTEAFGRQNKYSRSSTKWGALTESVVRYIAKEMLPFTMVEKPAF